MDPVQSQPNFTSNIVPESGMEVSSKLKKYLLLFCFVVVGIIFWQWINNPMIVTVTGVGTVSVPATSAVIQFTLSSNDSNVQNAVSSVQTKADTITQFLKNSGVAETDISRSQVTAVPSALINQGATGYQATISMSAKTIHVSDVSSLTASLYTNGALIVNQPVLSVDNQSALQQQALNSAMKDADSQAFKLGLSKWKLIKKIVSVTQATSGSTSTSTTKADTLTSANNQTAAANGVFQVANAVSVVYKMW